MKALFTFFIVAFGGFMLLGQSTVIKGRVFDGEMQKPLRDASVYINIQGYPMEVTNSDGEFSFLTDHLDISAYSRYDFTFYKPGYEKLDTTLQLPILGPPIELKKSASGYIQIREFPSGSFLYNIEVKHQGGKVHITDEFGFIQIPLPAGISPNQNYLLAIKGGCCHLDTALTFKAQELKNQIVQINLKKKKQDYESLTNNIDEELDQLYKGFLDNEIQQQQIHYANCLDLYHELVAVKKNRKEMADFLERNPILREHLDVLASITSNQPELSRIERNRVKAKEKFEQIKSEYYQKPPSLSTLEIRLEEWFMAGLEVLGYSVAYYKINPYTEQRVIDDAKTLEDFIKHIEKVIESKIPSHYEDREALINDLEDLIVRMADNIIKYLNLSN